MVNKDLPTISIDAGRADTAAVVGGAIASGGFVGAGLAILALQLPSHWQPAALAIVPTLASSCAIIVRVLAVELRRRYRERQWRSDRDNVVRYVEKAIPLQRDALDEIEEADACKILENGIARMQRIKALALSAYPPERPWLTELQQLADISVSPVSSTEPTISSESISLS